MIVVVISVRSPCAQTRLRYSRIASSFGVAPSAKPPSRRIFAAEEAPRCLASRLIVGPFSFAIPRNDRRSNSALSPFAQIRVCDTAGLPLRFGVAPSARPPSRRIAAAFERLHGAARWRRPSAGTANAPPAKQSPLRDATGKRCCTRQWSHRLSPPGRDPEPRRHTPETTPEAMRRGRKTPAPFAGCLAGRLSETNGW